MAVLERRELGNLAADPAGRHDGDFRLQADEALDDRVLMADGGPDVLDVGKGRHSVLALAVVAECRRLDHRWSPDRWLTNRRPHPSGPRLTRQALGVRR